MEKKFQSVLVSSTPHPQKNLKRLCSLFGNDSLPSPIQLEESKLKNNAAACVKTIERKPKTTVAGVNTVVPKRKRTTTKEKVESASNAVLKELNVKKNVNSKHALSHSYSMYNMFPEPIVLDSDEDDECNLVTSRSKGPPQKRNKNTAKLTAESTISKQDETGKSTDNKRRGTRTTRSKSNDKVNNVQKPKSSKTAQSAKKDVLDNATNIQTIKESNKLTTDEPQKSSQVAASPSVVFVDEKESIFSLLPDDLSDISEKDEIDFVPRNLKYLHQCSQNVNLKNKCVKEEASQRHKTQDKSNLKTVVGESSAKQAVNEKFKNEIASKRTEGHEKNQPIKQPEANFLSGKVAMKKKNTDLNENLNPFGCISQFQNVIFKHNRHCGGIIAKCLDTGINDIGFLEVSKKEVFVGTRSKTTFVVLEGMVEATQMNATQTLVPGDILHIKFDAEYKFVNSHSDTARLLYIREKAFNITEVR